MKISENYIDEYFVRSFIQENWEEIILMIESSIVDWGELGQQIIEELKKYELGYMSLKKIEDKENDEE